MIAKRCFMILAAAAVIAALFFGIDAKPTLAAEKKTEIIVTGGRSTDPYFAITVGVCNFINEDSTWLKATPFATGGLSDTSKFLIEDPDKRKKLIGQRIDTDDITLGAQKGFEPKLIAPIYVIPLCWVTLNKDIKEMSDFAGKIVGCARLSADYWNIQKAMLEDIGVMSKVKKLIHGGVGANVNAVRDGAADAGTVIFTYIWPDQFIMGQFFEELATKGDVYIVNQDEAVIAKACKRFGLPPLYATVKAGFPGPQQNFPRTVLVEHAYWECDASMDADVVYEFTKILFKHAGEYGRFAAYGKGMTKEFMSRTSYPVENVDKLYHPGALRYFKEAGITIKAME